MHACLRRVKLANQKDPFFVLIIDAEGLLSIEKNDESFDKKLMLFSMACSKKLVINVKGDINSSL